MSPRRCSAASFLIFALPGMLAAQASSGAAITPHRCGTVAGPTGFVANARGTISFVVLKNGTPDTTSLAVTAAEHLSVAGLRSIVVRNASTWCYPVPKGAVPVDARWVADVSAQGLAVTLGAATLRDAPPGPLAVEPIAPSPDQASQPVEESAVPIFTSCSWTVHRTMPSKVKRPPPPPIETVQPLNARATRDAEAASAARRDAVARSLPIASDSAVGTGLIGRLLVRADGHPDSLFHVDEMPADGAQLPPTLPGLAKCRFHPGRFRGTPVDSWIRVEVTDSSLRFILGP